MGKGCTAGAWCASLLAGAALAGGGSQNVLVIVNGQSDSSLQIANAYQQQRGIPERNLLYLESSNTAAFYTTGAAGDLRRTITSASFRTNLLWPALGYIRAQGLTNQIDYLVFSSDIPTRVDGSSESNATAGIAGSATFALTAMASFADLVELPNSASNMSLTMATYRGSTYSAAQPSTLTTNLTHATVWSNASPPRARQYYMSTLLGWTDTMGNSPSKAGSTFMPGSLVESLTSWSGILDASAYGQFRMTQHLGLGVAGTSGSVTEPYAISGKFPAARMHAHYARGCSLGEAFYQSVSTPYHLLIMGDPLCRPFAQIPEVTVTNLSDGDTVTRRWRPRSPTRAASMC
ncbi:MAG: hypothetical protein BWK77_06980 [Verrucomicrobia bacterium A1]|nr:MAG: hypothetical protein BWK77_06980 [Verrucomicrobia bacterium A1]